MQVRTSDPRGAGRRGRRATVSDLRDLSWRSRLFLSLNCPECNAGQFRDQKSRDLHEKSRDLSNHEIFQHKILKSQSLKKRGVYWYFYATLNIISQLNCFIYSSNIRTSILMGWQVKGYIENKVNILNFFTFSSEICTF
jgi:hypothetical protein